MESSPQTSDVDVNPDIHYPWYKVLKNPEKIPNLNANSKYLDFIRRYNLLEQGDFLFDFSYIKPKTNVGTEIDGDSLEYDLIILSQTCDLIHGKLESILVAPVWNFAAIEEMNKWYKSSEAKEALRRGHQPNYHLLNECEVEPFKKECFIVDFKNVFAIPTEQVNQYVNNSENRLRLLSPYREHLSQSFARFFMRVGLPIDIKPFASKAKINYEMQ